MAKDRSMNEDAYNDIVKALREKIGEAEDNLSRATLAARGRDTSVEWGQSGQSLQSIIYGYEREKYRWTLALAEFEKIVGGDLLPGGVHRTPRPPNISPSE